MGARPELDLCFTKNGFQSLKKDDFSVTGEALSPIYLHKVDFKEMLVLITYTYNSIL